LLLRAVDTFYPRLASLLQEFQFIPGWRPDNLMISLAAPQGSIGPHIDRYDVFLLQAQGRKRWQISQQADIALLPGLQHWVLANFQPQQEWILEAGDMLYLPPSVAHYGVDLDGGQTYSIGFRSDSAVDTSLAMQAGDTDYWHGRYLSETGAACRPLSPPLCREEWRRRWRGGTVLQPQTRFFYQREADGGVVVFAQGQAFPLPPNCAALAFLLNGQFGRENWPGEAGLDELWAWTNRGMLAFIPS
jgi:hypothetical protein